MAPCTSDTQCGGGVCVSGACCPSVALVCGTSCCTTSEVCFANACVTPGGPCRTADDCDAGQYCEPGLGETDAGMGDIPADGGAPEGGAGEGGLDGSAPACLGTAPTPGRCVDLPPHCTTDPPPPGSTCIRDCEYHPPVGPLNAVSLWQWGPVADRYPNSTDVWATPTVGRVTDTNCDGRVDSSDPPNVIFVSGNAQGTCCSCGSDASSCNDGVLRVLDGRTGHEIWSLRNAQAGSMGFSGLSVAIGDLDHDGFMEIAAVTGEGYIVLIDRTGHTIAVSNQAIPSWDSASADGWGGGLTIADMDHDGFPEIAYGGAVFTTAGGGIHFLWQGGGDWGRGENQAISVFVNLDADANLELLAGRTAYKADGSVLWDRSDLPNGFSAVGDFNGDGKPDVALVASGRIYLLAGDTGMDEVTSLAAPGSSAGSGGPPTVADFDGDGKPEIGVAFANHYVVAKPDFTAGALTQLWASPNHDFSSSVTGSTVFDFEGDGKAEVIYNDECFLWVFDGATGAVRFAAPTTSFTATEASLVADVDGDGHADIVKIANGADPSTSSGWGCNGTYQGVNWNVPAPAGAADYGRPAWVGSDGAAAPYRGITVYRDAANSWVGTRTLWNEHAYSVSNICGDRGDPCMPPGSYGDIPQNQVDNWSVPFLNNFRQNVQGEGIFDAPDATVSLEVQCTAPLMLQASVRNLGAAILPAGVTVGFYTVPGDGGAEVELGTGMTTTPLFPGQVGLVTFTPSTGVSFDDTFHARILVDPTMPLFHECDDTNDQSADVTGHCIM